jgi:hypothetical protein
MAGCKQRSDAPWCNDFLKEMRARSNVESLRTIIIRRFIICTVPNSQRVDIPHYYPKALCTLMKDKFGYEDSKDKHEH